MGIISWHTSTVFYFFLIGIISKTTILDGDYSAFVSIAYYLALIWLVYKYANSYEPSKVQPTDFNVCIVGAGFSGINMGIKLKKIGKKFISRQDVRAKKSSNTEVEIIISTPIFSLL